MHERAGENATHSLGEHLRIWIAVAVIASICSLSAWFSWPNIVMYINSEWDRTSKYFRYCVTEPCRG